MKNGNAKPFLKWAGGKSQLLPQFEHFFPEELKTGKITNYYEPFIGGGAVFFFVIQNYSIKNALLSDINEELILIYKVIQKDVKKSIEELKKLSEKYFKNDDMNYRADMFYDIRKYVNFKKADINFSTYDENWIKRAACLIFLNKTCFNGLFRLNKKGEFNVPFGKYKNPMIVDENNLKAVSDSLHGVTIEYSDFLDIKGKLTDNFFIYLDPPYRPISPTSSFTSYSKYDFDDDDQKRLAYFFKEISKNGSKVMLSNSNPKNLNPDDNFFEELYGEFKINKVFANRMINSNPDKRGKITELLITSY